MPYELPTESDGIADAILLWCGVDNPTPSEMTVAELAAQTARDAINGIRDVEVLESQYRSLAVEMGVYLWQKRGVDGAVSFSENGVAQSFEKGSLPPSMLARVTPIARTG